MDGALMETRNILDPSSAVIGTMTMPDGTAEPIWTAALAIYSTNNPVAISAPVLEAYTATATGDVTISSSTPTTITSMALTPKPGRYLVLFNADIYTDGASAAGEYGIYIDDVLQVETKRAIFCNLTLIGGLVTVSLNRISVGTAVHGQFDLNGVQVVDVKFKSTNGGTIGFSDRVLKTVRLK